MTNKEFENKLIELEIRIKGLELLIQANHDMLWKVSSFDKDYMIELKKKLKDE